MVQVSTGTLKDLEFDSIRKLCAEYCITPLGHAAVMGISPMTLVSDVAHALNKVNEYLSSFDNDNTIPNHGFEDINKALKMMSVENTYLEIVDFRNIASLADTANALILFFKKFKDYYPSLYEDTQLMEPNKTIRTEVDTVIDKFGIVKDNASALLSQLRRDTRSVQGKINTSFVKALDHYQKLDFLDDIRETVVDNRRVLAVKAMYRKKVKGSILGSSKTGSLVYMEPESTFQLHRELQNLQFEEHEEIIRLLKTLTAVMRSFAPELRLFQFFLIDMDVVSAKAKMALALNAVLPHISETREVEMINAYHPLLYLSNLNEGLATYPQTITMNLEHRVIVISGPNAGGKSITLKTVGLLQLMLQSGFLVPVKEGSSMCFFERILSDIGDNQSIENHLSTYSYRLKQMRNFLNKCNPNTLFLIDEFGTGSDPELGGALAEVFLEEFNERQAMGMITTHYANLKLLANELPNLVNANMQFDENTLEPRYKLIIGQAGSSFTFEVAQKNGIPYSLINKAKKKIESGKIRFDKTIVKLQKEREKMEKISKSLETEQIKKLQESDKMAQTNAKIQKKLESYQELYDHNQRLIHLGQKFRQIGERYDQHHRKKQLMAEVLQLVELENSKRKNVKSIKKDNQNNPLAQISQEVQGKIQFIRNKKKKKIKKVLEKAKPALQIGDEVRLFDGKAIGTVESLEKGKALINYGAFTTKAAVEQLELVKPAKI